MFEEVWGAPHLEAKTKLPVFWRLTLKILIYINNIFEECVVLFPHHSFYEGKCLVSHQRHFTRLSGWGVGTLACPAHQLSIPLSFFGTRWALVDKVIVMRLKRWNGCLGISMGSDSSRSGSQHYLQCASRVQAIIQAMGGNSGAIIHFIN